MEKSNLTPKEFFESEWYKDGVRQLCFDGWPGFVVPVNIQVKNLIEQNDHLLSKLEEKERECERLKHILFQIDFAMRPYRYDEELPGDIKWEIYALAADNGKESKGLFASGGK